MIKKAAVISLLIIATYAWWTSAYAQGEAPIVHRPLVLTGEQGSYPLGLHMEVLEDPSGRLTIDQAASPAYAMQFTPSRAETPVYGYTESVYWVRFSVDNRTGQPDEWLLALSQANMHYVDVYVPVRSGAGYVVKRSGVLRPISTRDVLNPLIIFSLDLPAAGAETLYVRFQSSASMNLGLTLWSEDAFLNRGLAEQFVYLLIFGGLLILILYHLFLLVSLKDARYLFFVFLLCSLLGVLLFYFGYGQAYVLPNQGWYILYGIPISYASLFLSIGLFFDAFLEFKTRFPKLHRLNMLLALSWVGLMLLTFFVSTHDIHNWQTQWSLVYMIVILVIGMASWRWGSRPAVVFMIAWLGMVGGLFLLVSVRMGILPSTPFTENTFQLGWVLMAGGWAIALADRVNLLQAEAVKANRELHASEKRLSQILDGMPHGVVLYARDLKPTYANRTAEQLLDDPARGLKASISAGRNLLQSIQYFSIKQAGTANEYPLELFPVFSALNGRPASADDIELDRGDTRLPLEISASPILDERGNVESAVVVFQEITERKWAEAELAEHRKHLEELVQKRTEELKNQAAILDATNRELRQRVEWLAALNFINQIVTRTADYTQIYAKIIDVIKHLFATSEVFIAELDAHAKKAKILAHSATGEGQADLTKSIFPMPSHVLGLSVLEQGRMICLDNEQLDLIADEAGALKGSTNIQCIVVVPLLLREQVLGFIGLGLSEQDRLLSDEESTMISIISTDIAQLIEDARQFEKNKALIAAEERARLARDLHDSVTQSLFSATMVANVLPQIWQRDASLGLLEVKKLRRLTHGALAEMRTMLLELRPAALSDTSLNDLLTQLVQAMASRSGFEFQLFIEKLPDLPEDLKVTYYRIAQEALNNVAKHAQANLVSVRLSHLQLAKASAQVGIFEISMQIEDDGVGFATTAQRNSEHLGLGIMGERAAAIRANLSIESRPGHGTCVRLYWQGELGSDYD